MIRAKHSRRGLLISIPALGLLSASPAHADPITAAILGSTFLATTAGAVVGAIVTFALTSIAALVVSKLLSPTSKAQDRQASVMSLQIGESPRVGIFGTCLAPGDLFDGELSE